MTHYRALLFLRCLSWWLCHWDDADIIRTLLLGDLLE